jgi:hypothetical protein
VRELPVGLRHRNKLAVVDPHVDLVDDYLAAAADLGAPIVAVFETHVQADHVSGLPELVRRTAPSGVTDLLEGSPEGRGLRSWRTTLLLGIVLGGLCYTLLAGVPDAGSTYSWLDSHLTLGGEVAALFGAGLLIGIGARTAGGCTSGHGLTGAALASPASLVSISTIMATAIATTLLLNQVP